MSAQPNAALSQTVRIGINEEASDLAAALCEQLTALGFTVLISRLRPEALPGQVVAALCAAAPHLTRLDCGSDDQVGLLTAAEPVVLHFHVVLLPLSEVLAGPVGAFGLAVQLSRSGKSHEQVSRELGGVIELASNFLSRRLLWISVLSSVPEGN